MNNVSTMEPKRRRRVSSHMGGDGGLVERVKALEADMVTVKADVSTASVKATEAAANTAELLAIVTATKGAAAFAKKHGPRFVSFVTGIMLAAGIGNPAVLRFLATFLG